MVGWRQRPRRPSVTGPVSVREGQGVRCRLVKLKGVRRWAASRRIDLLGRRRRSVPGRGASRSSAPGRTEISLVVAVRVMPGKSGSSCHPACGARSSCSRSRRRPANSPTGQPLKSQGGVPRRRRCRTSRVQLAWVDLREVEPRLGVAASGARGLGQVHSKRRGAAVEPRSESMSVHRRSSARRWRRGGSG